MDSLSRRFIRKSNRMDDTCLDHGEGFCTVVCVEQACKDLNQGQPAPLCRLNC